jgi:hypothetical protein
VRFLIGVLAMPWLSSILVKSIRLHTPSKSKEQNMQFPLTEQERQEANDVVSSLLEALKKSSESVVELSRLVESRVLLLDESILKEIRSATRVTDSTVFKLGVSQYKNRNQTARLIVLEPEDPEPNW